jgi:ferredoxin-thioredoxin reductase catalytic subunit
MNQWTRHDTEYQSLLDKVTGLAKQNGCALNPDQERVEKVVGLMTENLVASGKTFCPCKQSHPLDPAKDVTCPCPEWKTDITRNGHCFCRLFYREDGR